jgi:hypothetical protein
MCGVPGMVWLLAAARPERRGEVWRWGTGGEEQRHRARWSGRELTRGAARCGGGGGAAARLTDVAEASSAHASVGGTARTASGDKAQWHSSRCEEGGSGSTWLSSVVAQAEASPLEHGTRDVQLRWSQTRGSGRGHGGAIRLGREEKGEGGKEGGPSWVHHVEGGGGGLVGRGMWRGGGRALAPAAHETSRGDQWSGSA